VDKKKILWLCSIFLKFGQRTGYALQAFLAFQKAKQKKGFSFLSLLRAKRLFFLP
jgi:hypothetical protein